MRRCCLRSRLFWLRSRPGRHWGKVHTFSHEALEPYYPRMADFRALRERMDPKGKFANEYVDRLIGR